MMKRRSRRLLRFGAILVGSFVVLSAIWLWAAPHYTGVVSAVARPVFRLVEAPNITVLDAQGDELWIYRKVGEGMVSPVVWFDRYVFFGIVPLLALLLATPGLGLRRRAARSVIGLVALYIVHVGYIVASVELLYASSASAAGALETWQVVVRVLWEAAPLLIWIALTAPAWVRVLREVRTEGTETSGSPSADPVRAEG